MTPEKRSEVFSDEELSIVKEWLARPENQTATTTDRVRRLVKRLECAEVYIEYLRSKVHHGVEGTVKEQEWLKSKGEGGGR